MQYVEAEKNDQKHKSEDGKFKKKISDKIFLWSCCGYQNHKLFSTYKLNLYRRRNLKELCILTEIGKWWMFNGS